MNPSDAPKSSWIDRLPPGQARLVTAGLSIGAGLLTALMIHYLLYRVGLPSKPFIYVAF